MEEATQAAGEVCWECLAWAWVTTVQVLMTMESKKGFVVVIEGSTPNKKDLEFLNPPTAGTDRSQWGFFTQIILSR